MFFVLVFILCPCTVMCVKIHIIARGKKKVSKRRNFWFTIINYSPRLRLLCVCTGLSKCVSVLFSLYWFFSPFTFPTLYHDYTHTSLGINLKGPKVLSLVGDRPRTRSTFLQHRPPGTSAALFANAKPIIYKSSQPTMREYVCGKQWLSHAFYQPKTSFDRDCQSCSSDSRLWSPKINK